MGVVPPSVAAAFHTQVGVESSLVCHGQDTVLELVVDIHYIGVQMRGGPEFSVGDEFVLVRAVFSVPMRQPQQNDVLCAGSFSGVLKRMVLLRQGWRCPSLQCHQVW